MKKIFLRISIIIAVVILSLFLIVKVYANSEEIKLKVNITDEKVANYVKLSNKATSYEEKQRNLMLAVDSIDKVNLTEENAKIVAMLDFYIAENARKNADFETAFRGYIRSYNILKQKNIHKNDFVAFYDLVSIYYFGDIANSRDINKFAVDEIENTQMDFLKHYAPKDKMFSSVYKNLADYYSSTNKKKSEYYMKLYNKYN